MHTATQADGTTYYIEVEGSAAGDYTIDLDVM
jgi:hypothetical protein